MKKKDDFSQSKSKSKTLLHVVVVLVLLSFGMLSGILHTCECYK